MEPVTIGQFSSILAGFYPSTAVGFVQLNRPRSSNAISLDMIDEIPMAMQILNEEDQVKCVVLSGKGKNFCSGLDFGAMGAVTGGLLGAGGCPAETRRQFLDVIQHMQEACTAFESCSKPVIAAVHGACFGGGVDIVTACDIRLCTHDAKFCVKEVDLAITADLGTLQRLPYIVGEGRARDMALTARVVDGTTALNHGLVSQVVESEIELQTQAVKLAELLASKPTLAVKGTKQVMLYGRGRRVEEGLQHVALWNSSMLWSHQLQDVMKRVQQRAKM